MCFLCLFVANLLCYCVARFPQSSQSQGHEFMKFDWLLRDSAQVTIIFFALVAVAVFTQLFKNTITRSLPYWLRALLKAAPALFLTWLSYYVGEPLTALMFLFCSLGDILLDLPVDKFPSGFKIGGISFAVELIFVCF